MSKNSKQDMSIILIQREQALQNVDAGYDQLVHSDLALFYVACDEKRLEDAKGFFTEAAVGALSVYSDERRERLCTMCRDAFNAVGTDVQILIRKTTPEILSRLEL